MCVGGVKGEEGSEGESGGEAPVARRSDPNSFFHPHTHNRATTQRTAVSFRTSKSKKEQAAYLYQPQTRRLALTSLALTSLALVPDLSPPTLPTIQLTPLLFLAPHTGTAAAVAVAVAAAATAAAETATVVAVAATATVTTTAAVTTATTTVGAAARVPARARRPAVWNHSLRRA